MRTPKPGAAVRGSKTGRPLMALLDFLGRRGTLRIGWELRGGALSFRELQRRCEITSPNVLASRLREGLELGIVEKDAGGAYRLTSNGEQLGALLAPFDDWAKRWASGLSSGAARGRSQRPGRR